MARKPDVTFFTNDCFQFLRNDKVGRQDRQLLVNVARAQAQNEIAGVQHISNVAMHPFKMRLITHSAMAMTRDFLGDSLATDSRNRLLARSINVGHNHTVGVVKGLSNSRDNAWFAKNGAAGTSSKPVCGESISLP